MDRIELPATGPGVCHIRFGSAAAYQVVHGEGAKASSEPVITRQQLAWSLAANPGRRSRPERKVRRQSLPQPDGPVAANGMNPRNTFDSFVVGANNQFAHAAAVAVAQALARMCNPLFVYGGVGLGKTHLMQAIGQYVLSHKKGTKVVDLSSEKFTNEFIDAIQQIRSLNSGKNTGRPIFY